MADLQVEDAAIETLAEAVGASALARQARPASTAFLLVVLALAGCGGQGLADAPRAPQLEFPDGRPNQAFSEDVWVDSVERGLVAHAVAVNSADFSAPDLLDLWSAARVRSMVSASQGDLLRGSAAVWMGPRPFEALEVVEAPGGRSAEVIGCAAEPDIVSEVPRPTGDGRAVPFAYLLELSPDGHRQIVGAGKPAEAPALSDGRAVTEELCATVEIRRPVFDPAPDLKALVAKDRDDVVHPTAATPAGRS